MTPVKNPQSSSRSHISENFNPNHSTSSSPVIKSKNSPAIKSEKSKKSVAKSLNQIVSPRNKVQERRFVVAKKNPKKASTSATITCKCKDKIEDNKKCPCIAYQTLRASQEDFFRNRSINQSELENSIASQIEDEEEKKLMKFVNEGCRDESETLENSGSFSNSPPLFQDSEEIELPSELGTSMIKRRRNKLLEEARSSVPEPGSGNVKDLVKAFERLLSTPNSEDLKETEGGVDRSDKGLKWGLHGFQSLPILPDIEISSNSFSPPGMFFKSGNFEIGSSVSSSLDSSHGSITSRISAGGRRSRRNSSDSSETFGLRRWKKKRQARITSQKPFKLRTEQRGRYKEEEFVKKVQEMFTEEEKKRIPIAQGLPWTTDEPEQLVKPPVKDITRPLDLKLHSDVRAVDRADFDHHVFEKLSLVEQYRLERDRQQKLEEEEELKRLRKELVPKAQPMPYFDRPFIPKRSEKNPTVPKEPKFHLPHHKKIKSMSLNDMNMYTHHQ